MIDKTSIKYLFVDIGGVVHLRKPDPEIFWLAMDTTQTSARQVIYIENTPMFVQIAEGMGIRSILHTEYSFDSFSNLVNSNPFISPRLKYPLILYQFYFSLIY